MEGQFAMAAGSVLGRNHARLGKNNQDGYYSLRDRFATVAVVCDGCGSRPHSEVGAKLGSQLVAETLRRQLNRPSPGVDWQQLKYELLIQLETIARAVCPAPSFIEDYFLFTVVGTAITPLETVIFSLGDGVFAINGCVTTIPPYPDNSPPYLAYGLLAHPGSVDFCLQAQIPTERLESVLIGTDGIEDLMTAADRLLPGKQEKVGAIAQFWQDDRYFKNPDRVRRKLSLINRNATRLDPATKFPIEEPGLLADDATLMVFRKIPKPSPPRFS